MKNDDAENKQIFFPYYINQGRLLDIYAIINSGYSEYAEITTAISGERSKRAGAEVSLNAGFKIFNFGGKTTGSISNVQETTDGITEHKVQTVTSVLSIVMEELEKKKYIKEIEESDAGDFICIPVVLSINSIKALITELTELIALGKSMQKIGVNTALSKKDIKDWETIKKALHTMFSGEEILYETDKYAMVGTIVDGNLYQAVREDLIGTKMKCLAKVKRRHPNGTELMKNTIFSKLKNKDAKEELMEAFNKVANEEIFDFQSVAIPYIKDKPVYEVEIVALYQ